jgi:predicted dehydrogenase
VTATTRLGVAGLGWLGESLIKDVPRVPELEVAAVQDAVPARATEVAAAYGIGWSGQRFEDLVARPDVDAVVICTPNGLHAQQAQAALRAGRDVLVQKPLALSRADAQSAIEAAAETSRLLFVDYTYRFLETTHLLREAIESAGAVQSMRAAFHNIYGPGADKTWFFDPAQAGGGALTDLGVHLLDLGFWLRSPGDVRLEQVDMSDKRPVEHSAQLRLRLDDVPFAVDVSWNAPLPATEIVFEVSTADGLVRWENVDGSFFRFRTLHNHNVLLDRETTLREDTLRAFAAARSDRSAPRIDVGVYEVLDRAYGRHA